MDRIKRCLKMNKGEEYKIRLGCVYEREGLFYDSYRHGAEILKETLQASDRFRKRFIVDNCGPVGTEDDNAYEFSNNIIAFCGGRGRGKSSSMRTFAHALEHIESDRQSHSAEAMEKFWGMPILDYSFDVLPVIDPTMMREQDFFMRVILSRMFAQVKRLWESLSGGPRNHMDTPSRSGMPGASQIEQIMEGFRECYAYLDTFSKKPDIDNRYDDLEEIASLGDSGNLRSKFRGLVRCYLDIMSQGRPKRSQTSYLVLQIDDADLNIDQAYGILEDIRSFCMVPEVIILLAMNMEQLQQIIEQHYVRDFDLLLRYCGKGDGMDVPLQLRDCRHMSMRYIDKVIPVSRQIHLPEIDSVIKDEAIDLSINYVVPRKASDGKDGTDVLGEMDNSVTDFQERLLGWLYQKIGIALIRPTTYRHNILPEHLRELAHFLAFFGKMESLNADYNIVRIHALLRQPESGLTAGWREKRAKAKQAKDCWITNLQGLEQYFLMNWSGLHLSREGQRMVQDVEAAADTIKPQMICEFCDGMAARLHMSGQPSDDGSRTRYSYAYVMNKLSGLSPAIRKEEDYNIVYALRFYYMLHFYRKLIAMAGDDAGYAKLLQEVNYEGWVPDYSRMPREFSNGRFEVNLRALLLLHPEFGKGGAVAREALLGSLNQMLYVIEPTGKARGIEKKDIQMYANRHPSGGRDDIRVMFDWSFCLMSLLLRRPDLYTLPAEDEPDDTKTWEIRMDILNMGIQFLFNWDVQHYLVRNMEQTEASDYDNSSMLVDWLQFYWHKLVEMIGNQKYIGWMEDLSALTSNKMDSVLSTVLPSGFDTIYYGNEEYLKRLISEFADAMDGLISRLEAMKDEPASYVTFIRMIIAVFGRCPVDFRGSRYFGDEAEVYEKIMRQCNSIFDKYRQDTTSKLDFEQISPILDDCKRFRDTLKRDTIVKIDKIFAKETMISRK